MGVGAGAGAGAGAGEGVEPPPPPPLGLALKVAVSVLSASRAMMLQGEGEQLLAEPVPPLKPAKLEPDAALALTSTLEPSTIGPEQEPKELVPTLHSTVPEPPPARVTPSVCVVLSIVPVRALSSSIVKLHSLDVVPLQLSAEPLPALQPTKLL